MTDKPKWTNLWGIDPNYTEGMPDEPTYTAAEVKVLTETASKVALELGRREAEAAIRALAELVALKDGPRDAHYVRRKPLAWQAAREILQDLRSQPSGAASDATSVPGEGPGTSEPSKAAKTPQEGS